MSQIDSSIGESTELTWKIPGRLWSDPARAALILTSLTGISYALGLWLLRSPLLAVLGPAMLLGMTAEAWATSTFRLTDRSASLKRGLSHLELKWSEVRHRSERDGVIHLSPLTGDTAAQRFRGVRLILPEELPLAEKIRSFVDARTPETTRSSSQIGGEDAHPALPGSSSP